MIGNAIHLSDFPFLQHVTPFTLPLIAIGFTVASLLAYAVGTEIYRRKVRLRGVPGPSGLPIVGNLNQLGPDPADTLHQWGKRYGGVYQISLGTRPVVIFDSMKAAREVFIGQGTALIDKPVFYTFHQMLSSVASSIGTTKWSDSTKRRRKTAMSAMNRPAVASYLPFIDDITKTLISDLWSQGHGGEVAFDPRRAVSKTITDLTMSLNYGARLPPEEDLFQEIIDIEDGLSRIKTPLGSNQDYVPILRYLPGNNLSARAKEINRRRLVYLHRFKREMEERIEKQVDKPCIQGNCIKDPETKLDEIDLMSISMSMVSGGLDTMVNTIAWAIGTLALRQDIQDKAYNAICDVYGPNSWGPIGDENSVPYISALVKESLRTFTVLRLSLPRRAWKDIQYGEIFIPKGTTIFLNAWGCNRDESVYGPDVNEFRPERFAEDPDLPHAAYGFGTRMCAGFNLANRQLYILLLRLIWAFKIDLSKDPSEKYQQLRPLEDVSEPFHLAAIPPDYKVRLVPRNEEALRNMLAA
ncbi:cytochrome P450 [Rhizodiscina lignyota]|uniref:Cytochrome P450 n=1 Tax=Rhizodiscina lignyota TaxID=1504668 RepID=A0A9P4IAB0_9PEZI|nr:cytochrome P450 [Rhizodiscina lignyota]